ncbi:hypothetical protein [Roseibium marinum]|uniref:Membrane bound FAD containing D-sorbitol dehydrogenase n=1 Tax=Roseibium marinum TaxID=281252 RepID=A0A2S3UY64_9HYPH|nr:hypothetical protein [Roseibium marinum]POF32389.1 hypothetical protein CLV41_103312 [Roseibium marinum]
MTQTRRFVIKSAGALGAGLLAPNLPMWALAHETPQAAAPPDFVAASSALVGISATALTPPLKQDGISLGDLYYSVAEAGMPGAVASMLSQYSSLSSNPPQTIANTLLRMDKSTTEPQIADYGVASRLTMMMWLFGVWYGGTEITNIPGSASYIAADYQADFIVSSRAYKNGWIWRIAQAHPMGFSHFNYGSWGSEPPELSDYLTVQS